MQVHLLLSSLGKMAGSASQRCRRCRKQFQQKSLFAECTIKLFQKPSQTLYLDFRKTKIKMGSEAAYKRASPECSFSISLLWLFFSSWSKFYHTVYDASFSNSSYEFETLLIDLDLPNWALRWGRLYTVGLQHATPTHKSLHTMSHI